METGAAAIAGLITVLGTIFGIVLAVLMLLLPFFVLRIRREVIEINDKLSIICNSLKPAGSDAVHPAG